MGRFLARPLREKARVLTSRLAKLRVASGVPSLKKIEPGFSYLVWNDAIRQEILNGTFEPAEQNFAIRYLQPGMTVLDIGAYYGLYTLIASSKVGPTGQVIAFEPSPEQRKKLRWNLALNRSKNVRVEDIALSSNEGQAEFFSVLEGGGGFSGLRRPDVTMKMRAIQVHTATLDSYLSERSLTRVDFVKIDVEGGELDVFKGATGLLSRPSRPVVLCELQDTRSEAWGHLAKDTAAFLERLEFRWFKLFSDGNLGYLAQGLHPSERNFVAVPPERMKQVEELLGQ